MSTPKISLIYPAEVDLIGLDGKRKKMMIYFDSPADRAEYITLINNAIEAFEKLNNKLTFLGPKVDGFS